MKKNINIYYISVLFPLTFCLLLTFALPADAGYIDKNSAVELELVPSSRHDFSSVKAYNKGNEFIVTGKLKHKHHIGTKHITCSKIDHVDLVIYNQDGTVLESTSLPILKRGRHKHKLSRNKVHFRFKLSMPLSKAHKLRLALHEKNSSLTKAFECGDNQAVSGK